MMDVEIFQSIVKNFYKKFGREFPWRETDDPYRIWLSEVMLQQTQTDRVVPKYMVFITRFPKIEELAEAEFSEVLSYWQGLGYNRRALNLHACAKEVVRNYDGNFPPTIESLEKLPGIGPYTARAVATFGFDQVVPFIETNIRTVYLHHFFVDEVKVSDKTILEKIEITIDKKDSRNWFYALMDYGVYLKKTVGNLNVRSKHYVKQSKFEGSNRQIRGGILRLLGVEKSVTIKTLETELGLIPEKINHNVEALVKEGFIVKDENGNYRVK